MASLLEHLEAAGERCTPEFRSAFRALEARVAELETLMRSQAEEIRELKRQLRRYSGNSSLPPSSDPPHLKPPRSKPKGRVHRGAQPGHDPHQRSLLPESRVNGWVDHYPTSCRRCGQRLERSCEAGRPERRQVIELPPIRAEVTEHRLHRLRCAECHRTTSATAPAAVAGAVTFGPRMVAFSAVLTVRLRASRRGVRRVLADLLDVELPCLGTLQQLLEEASAACLPAYQQVRSALRASAALGVDETGWSLRGRQYWLWTGVTPTLSFFRLAARRSGWARERLLGKRYAGVVTSDRLAAYNGVPPPQRQLCWAHLKRDFTDWQSYDGAAGRIGTWAAAEAERLFVLWHRFRAGEFDRAGLRWHLRALRAGVIWRKISLGSQSGRGLRLVERLLTVAETCKKQKKDLFAYLSAAFDAYRNGQVPPLLISTS